MAKGLSDKRILSEFPVEEPDAGKLHVRFSEGLLRPNSLTLSGFERRKSRQGLLDDIMKNVNVTLRVDEDLKRQADALFSELGLNLTTAFNIFLRQSVREQQIPFQVSKNVPNAVTLAAMDASERGEDIYGPYDSVSDLMEALNA